jgi:hypothetical protein
VPPRVQIGHSEKHPLLDHCRKRGSGYHDQDHALAARTVARRSSSTVSGLYRFSIFAVLHAVEFYPIDAFKEHHGKRNGEHPRNSVQTDVGWGWKFVIDAFDGRSDGLQRIRDYHNHRVDASDSHYCDSQTAPVDQA